MTDVRYDEGSGIIHFSGDGFWSADALQRFGTVIHEAMLRSRREFGTVAILVVSGEPRVQTPEVVQTAQRQMDSFEPGDRIANVMSSALVKMQAKRTLPTDNYRTFASENEALAWLTTDRRPLHSAAPRQAAG